MSPASSAPETVPTASHAGRPPPTSLATMPLSVGQHLDFDHISTEQGLSQNTVFCILQDKQGFMWFGTEDGLNKYDGYSFTIFRHDPEDPSSLGGSRILSVVQARSGELWIGTANGGLSKLELEAKQITRYQHDPDDIYSLSSNQVLSIHEDEAGELWVGTENGLNRFARETETFARYRHTSNDPASLSGDSVRAIHQDQDGDLWIGTDQGLDRLNPDHGGFAHFQNDPNDPNSLSHNSVRAVHEDSEGALWIGTDDGLNRLEPGSEQFSHYLLEISDAHGAASNEILSIFEDQSGVLWVGTDGGGLDFYDRDSDSFERFHHNPLEPSGLSNNFIRSIYQDREGVLWIGTIAGGLNKLDYDERVFVHYRNDPNDPSSLSNNWVRSFWEDREGAVWIGTGGGGLNRFDPDSDEFTRHEHDPGEPDSVSSNFVSQIVEDSQGMLWLATGSGLDRLDPTTGRFKHYQHDPSDPTSLSESNSVWSILPDDDGILWVATIGGGLDRFDADTETFTRHLYDANDPQSLISNDVWGLAQAQGGKLWVGTADGLDLFDPLSGLFAHHRNDPENPRSLSHNFVGQVLDLQNGVTWVATIGGGLNRLERATGEFTHFREKDGMSSDMIMAFVRDGEGSFWITTLGGLTKLDPRTGALQNYDRTDGLPFDEFNGGALIRSSTGFVYAGGLEGFVVFHPDHIRDNPTVPPVVLTRITQHGQDIVVEETGADLPAIALEWPDNTFEFQYAALSYSNPGENQYAYYLEGLEETWNDVGTTRYGRYTNLPGGTYTLRVKGSNNDGIWNEAGAALQITVVPPFWATWWFRGIALLILVGGAFGGYRLRLRRVEARSQELEKLVEERTVELSRANLLLEGEIKERKRAEAALAQHAAETAVEEERSRLARELHDSVTQSLHSSTLMAEAGQRLAGAGDLERTRHYLTRLGEISQQALKEMRLLVYELRPLALRQVGLVGALQQRLDTVERRAGVETRLVVIGGDAEDGQEIELPPDLEEALYPIAQEALNNALKHAKPSTVKLTLRVEGEPPARRIELEVADDGSGFDVGTVDSGGGIGLDSMRERAEQVGGVLTIHSAPGEGTRVKVTIG
jgi:signal transduction histidine kinase/ligand-binding sensor domain-containing protein